MSDFALDAIAEKVVAYYCTVVGLSRRREAPDHMTKERIRA